MQNEALKTAPEIAYQIISGKIISGEYAPGQKLSRRKMADVSKVSVIPVIEALKRLEEDGLVESRPGMGSIVAIPTRNKVLKSLQVREAIECQVARIMSTSITPEQAAYLNAIAKELDTIKFEDDTQEESQRRHLRFHQSLAEYTGNELLVKTLDRVNLFWILCKAMGVRAREVEYPRYWHRKLMDDILSGDPDRAERSMREHIRDSADPILERIEEQENGNQ